MKIAGTLKVEIIKPLDSTWDLVGNRMHAMRRSLGHALNLTMRDLYPEAVAEINAIRHKDNVDQKWRNKIEVSLRNHWNSELAFSFENMKQLHNKSPKKYKDPDPFVFAPIKEYISAETTDLLKSRFTGEHRKSLIKGESSFPSWKNNVAFSARQRSCHIEGKADAARLTFPLWGTGKKAVTFVIAPCGGSARATWNDLVRSDSMRAEIVAWEKIAKDAKASPEDREEATLKLESLGATKMGKVGISYNERKRKWFMLITWTKHKPSPSHSAKKAVALNFGCNVFIQALCEDGTTWEDSGLDIRVMRERFRMRRVRYQRSCNLHGSGSRGHGKKRRELPVKRIGDAESRWVETRIRTTASEFVKWCMFHNVTDVYIEDLKGVRDSFERKTKGDAHEEVKRFIHSWSFYETTQAIEYECFEHGINVHAKSAHFNSQRCPSCGHTERDNVSIIKGGGDYIIHNKKSYRSYENWTRFKCTKCGLKQKGDIVTCANHLIDVGCTHTLEKTQEKSKKRISSSLNQIQPQK